VFLEQIGCHDQFDKNIVEAFLQWYMLEDDKHTKYLTNITNTSFPYSNTTAIIAEVDTIQKIEHIDDSIKTQASPSMPNKCRKGEGLFLSNTQQHKSGVRVELVSTCTEDFRMACQYLQQASATQILPCNYGTTLVNNG